MEQLELDTVRIGLIVVVLIQKRKESFNFLVKAHDACCAQVVPLQRHRLALRIGVKPTHDGAEFRVDSWQMVVDRTWV